MHKLEFGLDDAMIVAGSVRLFTLSKLCVSTTLLTTAGAIYRSDS
jgi:hypothetical protein